jgi:hypothetical protein
MNETTSTCPAAPTRHVAHSAATPACTVVGRLLPGGSPPLMLVA